MSRTLFVYLPVAASVASVEQEENRRRRRRHCHHSTSSMSKSHTHAHTRVFRSHRRCFADLTFKPGVRNRGGNEGVGMRGYFDHFPVNSCEALQLLSQLVFFHTRLHAHVQQQAHVRRGKRGFLFKVSAVTQRCSRSPHCPLQDHIRPPVTC